MSVTECLTTKDVLAHIRRFTKLTGAHLRFSFSDSYVQVGCLLVSVLPLSSVSMETSCSVEVSIGTLLAMSSDM